MKRLTIPITGTQLLHLLRAPLLGGVLSAIQMANLVSPAPIVRHVSLPGQAPQAPDQRKDIHQHWRETGLGFEELRLRAKNPVCHATPENFLGCVSIVNSLLVSAKLEARFFTGDRVLELEPRLGETLFNAGPARVVHVLPAPDHEKALPARQIFEKRRNERAATLESWMRLYSSGRKIDFERLTAWAGLHLKPENESEAVGAALNAFFAYVYDPHTTLLPRAFLEQESSSKGEEYSGIGIYGDKMGERFVVRQPIEGGPALRAGIRAGDVITHIDGTPITGMPREAIVSRIKGPTGSRVELGLKRGARQLTIHVPREKLVIDNVSSRMIEDRGRPMAVIKIGGFDKHDACSETREHLSRALSRGAQALILDLRGNPGGFVDQAVCVASLFLEKGQPIVRLRKVSASDAKAPQTDSVEVATGQKLTDAPLVVLLDAASASSSELVAGALRDHGRALIVGERSFGKGSVQSAEAFGDRMILYHTIMRFYQPSGSTNQLVGIHPDLVAAEDPRQHEDEHLVLREEDLYPNALPAVGAPATRAFPEQVAIARECVKRTGQAARKFRATARGAAAFAADYPLLVAQDALNCAAPNALAAGSKVAENNRNGRAVGPLKN